MKSNAELAKALAAKGMSKPEIASILGLDRSYVYQLLKKPDPPGDGSEIILEAVAALNAKLEELTEVVKGLEDDKAKQEKQTEENRKIFAQGFRNRPQYEDDEDRCG